MKNALKNINKILTKYTESYIYKVSRTLYPRPDLEDDDQDDDDHEPILFI